GVPGGGAGTAPPCRTRTTAASSSTPTARGRPDPATASRHRRPLRSPLSAPTLIAGDERVAGPQRIGQHVGLDTVAPLAQPVQRRLEQTRDLHLPDAEPIADLRLRALLEEPPVDDPA